MSTGAAHSAETTVVIKRVRFGDFLREVTVPQNQISYAQLMTPVEADAQGRAIPVQPEKLELQPMDIYRLVTPYVSVRFVEQLRAVLPLALYLAVFQMIVLQRSVADAAVIGGGLMAVMVGLMLFMEGLKLGLMPFGETIGDLLPRKSPLPVVLVIVFLLGVGVTFAEPAIGALQAAGALVSADKAPLLSALLREWSGALVLVVGLGVGLAALLGTLRFIYGWSLKPLIYASVAPTLLLTVYCHFDPELRKVIGLAWDCGGVTTGPVTVPLVLALGIGVASAVGTGASTLAGFGIVTLASVFPVVGVLLLGLYVASVSSSQAVVQAAAAAAASGVEPAWYETTPGLEIVMAIRAIVPLVVFLMFVLKVLLREKIREDTIVNYGLTLAVLGMILINLGLTYGLAMLGDQAGGLVPGAFTRIEAMSESPLYGFAVGISVAVFFGWFLGFGATLAEPALNALGMTVETLTNGAFNKSLLIYSVSVGVGIGIAVGVAKIIFDFPLTYLLVPGYAVALLLTALSSEEYVNVAWDSAGVTTGPVTVPLVLAMGLGFGKAVGAVEGFGVLAAASLFPIMAVLATGLLIEWRARARSRREEEAALADDMRESQGA
jgi:hypothetical protein